MSAPPSAETYAQLVISRYSYVATTLAIYGYGLSTTLFIIVLHFLYTNWSNRNPHYIATAYITLLFIASTIYIFAEVRLSEFQFVEPPVVSSGEFAAQVSTRFAVLRDVSFTVNIWLSDSFVIYRLYVVWMGTWYIMVLPILIYLSSIATGVGLLIESAKPDTVFGQAPLINFGVPFWSLSLVLNVLTTACIAGRLLHHRRRIQIMGRMNGKQYLSLAAVFVESAALYSLSCLIFIPMWAKNVPMQYPFFSVLGCATSVAPILIVLRVALGVAITKSDGSNASGSAKYSRRPTGSGNGVSLSSINHSSHLGHNGSYPIRGSSMTDYPPVPQASPKAYGVDSKAFDNARIANSPSDEEFKMQRIV